MLSRSLLLVEVRKTATTSGYACHRLSSIVSRSSYLVASSVYVVSECRPPSRLRQKISNTTISYNALSCRLPRQYGRSTGDISHGLYHPDIVNTHTHTYRPGETRRRGRLTCRKKTWSTEATRAAAGRGGRQRSPTAPTGPRPLPPWAAGRARAAPQSAVCEECTALCTGPTTGPSSDGRFIRDRRKRSDSIRFAVAHVTELIAVKNVKL